MDLGSIHRQQKCKEKVRDGNSKRLLNSRIWRGDPKDGGVETSKSDPFSEKDLTKGLTEVSVIP